MEEQLKVLKMQIWFLTQKFEKVNYFFHQIADLEVMKIKNMFMKIEVFIYQQNVKKN
jgi:hypothetical protein